MPQVFVLSSAPLAAYRSAAQALGAEAFLDKANDWDRLPAMLAAIPVRPEREMPARNGGTSSRITLSAILDSRAP